MSKNKRTLPLWVSRALAAVIFLGLVSVIGVVGYTLVTNQFIDFFVLSLIQFLLSTGGAVC